VATRVAKRSVRRRSAPPASPGAGESPDDSSTDPFDALVDAARRGDRGAFDELVRRTHRDTLRLALRLTADPEDARDVVQDAYLRAYKGIRRFRGDAQFSTWLYRITANCASSHAGRGARHRHDELDGEAAVVDARPESDPAVVAEAGALRRDLDAAIAELPDRLRAVVVLRDVYDLPHEAIAAELGISESAAKVRLHRARLRLRERLFADAEVEEDRRAV
jgi:RNA polymerase sigma-70 factor (ECF subfamily)